MLSLPLDRAGGQSPGGDTPGHGDDARPDKNPADVSARSNLTLDQLHVWMGQALVPGVPVYHVALGLNLFGPVDPDLFQRAFQTLVNSSDALRTVIAVSDGVPQQVVLDVLPYTMDYLDLSTLAEARRAATTWMQARCRTPLDMTRRLFDAALIRIAPAEYVWYLNAHHLIVDGTSIVLIYRQLDRLYAEALQGRLADRVDLPQFRDYVESERRYRASPRFRRVKAYWDERLSRQDAPISFYGPAGPRRTTGVRRIAHDLGPERTRKLRALAGAEQGGTVESALFGVFCSALVTYLHAVDGREVYAIGIPVHNRRSPRLKETIGFFSEVLPIRIAVGSGETLAALRQKIRAQIVEVMRHGPYALPNRPQRNAYDVVLNYHPYSFARLNGAPAVPEWIHTGHGSESLTLQIRDFASAGSVVLDFDFHCDVFDADECARAIGHFVSVVDAVLEAPDQPLERIDMLTPAERHRTLVEWNATEASCPPAAGVHRLFEAQVARQPDAIAVAFDGGAVSYGDLNARANRLARRLRTAGVGPGAIVGIHLERSPEMLVSVLAILKAGGAYLPLDPAYPREWLTFALRETQTALVLTETALAPGLALPGVRALCLDTEWPRIASESPDNLSEVVAPQHLAYLIYTSGSTGRPKGVEVTHLGLVNFAAWAARAFQLRPGDRVLQFASLSFDTAVEEILPALVTGATLVLRTDGMLRSVATFLQACREWGITVLDLPTSYWHEVADALDALDLAVPLRIRLTIIGGEQAHREQLQRWRQRVGDRVALVNTYGPTETTVVAAMSVLVPGTGGAARGGGVPIGRPIANVETYVLDRWLRPVPIGVRGELYIGGAGLARGYHRRPDLSAERFVPHPFATRPGQRLYRTGDLARYRPDGSLEVLGRLDLQVKVRGFRIEPGEIEAALREHPAVRDAAVVCREDERGDRRLTAYVVGDPPGAAADPDWRSFLCERLPAHMIPSAFVPLEALPRTPSGKVERGALPASNGSAALAEPTAPRSGLEQLLAAVWCDVLDVPRVGVHANFFELGGHSLLATQVVSRLRDALQVEVPLRALFDAPTIATLAHRLQAELSDRRAVSGTDAIGPAARDRAIPLSSAQRRMWFSHQLAPDSGAYNVAAPIRVGGILDREALMRSANELVRRHESLRTTFPTADGAPVQVIRPAEGVTLPEVDLRALPEPERLVEARRLLTESARRPFDVARGPLYRFLLVRVGDEDHLLLLTMHHLISDHWSLGVIGREIAALYNGLPDAFPVAGSTRPVQYADFTIWQGQRFEGEALDAQLAYWTRQLADLPALELPTDHPRPGVQTFHGAHVALDLPTSLLQGLATLSVRERVTPFMTLLAAFDILLHRYTGQVDIAIGVPIANRHWLAIEGTVGTFVNTLVMRTDLAGRPTFRELLGRVRETALEAYAHQDLPFEKLVEALQPRRDPSRPPLVSVHFNLQNAPVRDVSLRGLSWTPFEIDAWASQFDVSLAIDTEILRKMFFNYNQDLYERATVERMLGQYRRLLEAVIADPDARIADLPLLTDAERRELVLHWNVTAAPYPDDRCFHEVFEAQAARTPHAVAVELGRRRVTYRELNARANRVAHALLALGMTPEARVGICVERSIDMLAGLLGIMKAGGAYVPLDPGLPPDRLAFMLGDSDVAAVVTRTRLGSLPDHGAPLVLLDGDDAADARTFENPRSGAGPANLAYVIYTSGSTGAPKGVEVSHRALVNLLESMRHRPGLAEDDVVLAVTPISFDIAALELYLPLMVGARVVLASPETAADGRRLMQVIASRRVTVMQATPATWHLLLQAGWNGSRGLRILCGGEALAPDLAEALLARGASLWNMYGPTETTIWSTVWQAGNGSPSIGRPIANTQTYILDANLEPVPPGVPGELHIGGDGLARGYHRRPGLTAEKFIPDPFGEPGRRLFRTGDLATYLPDGSVKFLGRIDGQVKIRGHRIEPAEVEAALARDPAVQLAVVLAREDTTGDRRLVAYVVPRPGRVTTAERVRASLTRQLPTYMVPSAVVFLDRLPLTPSGKIDRRALPPPDPSAGESGAECTAPRDALERQLVEIWKTALARDVIGVHDNFFELGGHSLLAARLFVEIERRLGASLPVAALFQAPTVAQLALLMRDGGQLPTWTSLVELQRGGSRAPFFWVHGDASAPLLGRHLGPDQPLYGFRHQAADGSPARHVTVDAIAEHYLAELSTVQRQGPYFLGGYSFGAVVALEMAQRLRDRGHDVALLVLLYPSVPGAGRPAANEPRRPEAARRGPHRRLARLVARAIFAIVARSRRRALGVVTRLRLRIPASLRSLYILGIYFRALRTYAPRPYRSPALVFVEKGGDDQERYWLNVLTGSVEVHRLAAAHRDVIAAPHLETWAGRLRHWLERFGGHAATSGDDGTPASSGEGRSP